MRVSFVDKKVEKLNSIAFIQTIETRTLESPGTLAGIIV
jgi:hypothetical protein